MLATVERVEEIWPHPNADALEMARVLGYECIVRKGGHQPGELIVFIQPDTVLPADREWASEVLKYTRSGGRVKAARLRGEWSMGLVMPLDILPSPEIWGVDSVGCEVAEILGVTKYEPPATRNLDAKGFLPFGIPKTDEDRWQNVRDLHRMLGCEVDVTLKIDGSSFTAYCALPGDHPGEEPATGITSRSLDLKIQEGFGNPWVEAARKTGVLDLLQAYCVRHNVSLALRGEVYGRGVRNSGLNPHSKVDRGVAFFSVWNIREHRYEERESPHYFRRVCEELGLPTVPVLEEGVVLTKALLERYGDELEKIDGQVFEGVVVKGAWFSLKVVNKHYDSKK